MDWIKNTENNNQFWQKSFIELPTSKDMLCALPEASLQEPYYTAFLLIPALCMWSVNKKHALEMMNFLKGPSQLSMLEIQFIDERLRGKAYLPYSYFEGATPQNGYQPSKPYTLKISALSTSFVEAKYAKLYLQSNGADSPRPVELRQKPSSGQWFLWEQMLLSGIRIPVSEDPWA